MTISETQISIINLILGMIIFVFGILFDKQKKNPLVLSIGTAFAFFGGSHIFYLISSINKIIISLFILFRIIAYLCIIFTLNLYLVKGYKYKKILQIILHSIPLILIPIIFYLSKSPFTLIAIYSINTVFCSLIIILSFIFYKKLKNIGLIFLAIGFFCFMLSHLGMLLGLEETFTAAIIFTRLFAYFFIFSSIYSLTKTKVIKKIADYTSRGQFQISLLIFTIFMLIILFYFPHSRFNCTDPKPEIFPIIPSPSEEKIIEVETGLYIKNFSLFDITSNDFIVNVILWFEFDPHLISLDKLEQFNFENGKILQKSKAKTKIIENKILAEFRLRLQFKSNLTYKLFPIEDHTIYISLINTRLNPNEVILTTKNTYFANNENIFTADWIIKDKKTYYGYFVSKIDKYNPNKTSSFPKVSFAIDFEKLGIKDTLIIFVPLYLAFFLGLFSLALNIKNSHGILSLSVGSVTSFIFDLFIIQGMTPKVKYFTISDSIYTVLLLSSFAILIFNIFTIRQILQHKISENLILLRNYLFLFFIIFTLLSTYYVLY